jgi:hypothetical protein
VTRPQRLVLEIRYTKHFTFKRSSGLAADFIRNKTPPLLLLVGLIRIQRKSSIRVQLPALNQELERELVNSVTTLPDEKKVHTCTDLLPKSRDIIYSSYLSVWFHPTKI